MRQALETPFAHVYTKNEVVDVRFLRPDIAVAQLVKHISDERRTFREGFECAPLGAGQRNVRTGQGARQLANRVDTVEPIAV